MFLRGFPRRFCDFVDLGYLACAGLSDGVRFVQRRDAIRAVTDPRVVFHWDFVYFHSTERCPQSSQASVGVCDGHRTTEPQCRCDSSPFSLRGFGADGHTASNALAYCMPFFLPPSGQVATSSSI